MRCSKGGVVWFAMDLPDTAGEDVGSWTHIGDTGLQEANTEYEPSIRTDFSGMLPFATGLEESSVSENYDPNMIVQSAWKSLPSREMEMPWESGFWDKFLDPNVSAVEMMTRGIKRPAPFHVEPMTHDVHDDTVEQRVMAKQTVEVKNFCSTSKMFRRRHGEKNVKPFGRHPYAGGFYCWNNGRLLMFR